MIGYEELLTLFNDFESDSTVQKKIILTYRDRARKDGDTLKIARSYDRLARIFGPIKNIQYADSLIAYTSNWDHVTYPADGYLLKAYEYSRIGDIQREYHNLLKANEISEITGNLVQKIYILDRLISLKISWGDPDKAFEMQKKRHEMLLNDDFLDKISEVSRTSFDVINFYKQNLVTSYETFIFYNISVGNYEVANEYLIQHDSLIKTYTSFDKEQVVHWHIDAKMEINYFMGNYKESLDLSDSSLEMNRIQQSPYYEINANLYKGLSLNKLQGNLEAESFFHKADSIYQKDSDLLPTYSAKLLYDGLVKINQNNPAIALSYFDQLLKIDSTSLANYKILEPQFIRTFETPQLLKSKEKTIEKLQKKNRNSTYLIILSILVFVVSSIMAWNYYRQKVVYRRRYEKLMKNGLEAGDKNLARPRPHKTELSQEIIDDILRKLEKFEKNEDYLNANLSLMTLAKKFNTNSSYLSRVLNSSKSVNFSKYLNDLRINYAVRQIKNDAVFRKYTIEAIALECGYNNSASFSRSFYKNTGLYPSYFISETIRDL
jgi:AraC-like DNA-binding protein